MEYEFTLEEAIDLYRAQSERQGSTRLGFLGLSKNVRVILEENSINCPVEEEAYFSSRRYYRHIVTRMTNENCQHLDLSNRRFRWGDHVDHIVPVLYCFKNKIAPEVCASPENLQILKEQDNYDKGNSIIKEAKDIVDKWISEGRAKPYPHIITRGKWIKKAVPDGTASTKKLVK